MLIRNLIQDETGFIVSAELVLISTILVIGLIVGLSQVQYAVVEELNDVAHAIGSLNQSFLFTGFSAEKGGAGNGNQLKSITFGSAFTDALDSCDTFCFAISCDSPVSESAAGFAGRGAGGTCGAATVTP